MAWMSRRLVIKSCFSATNTKTKTRLLKTMTEAFKTTTLTICLESVLRTASAVSCHQIDGHRLAVVAGCGQVASSRLLTRGDAAELGGEFGGGVDGRRRREHEVTQRLIFVRLGRHHQIQHELTHTHTHTHSMTCSQLTARPSARAPLKPIISNSLNNKGLKATYRLLKQ